VIAGTALAGDPARLGTILSSWQLDYGITSGLIVSAGLYVWGVRRVRRRSGVGSHQRSRTVLFASGLGVIYLALQSPIDTYSGLLLSVHMVQHLMLTMVAPPLLLAGAPITLALQAASTETRRRILLPVLRSRAVRFASLPALGWGLFAAVMWATHFSSFYETALENGRIHILEHAAYLGAALLFWRPVIAVDPAPARLSHPARIFYLFLAMPVTTFLGLAIYGSDRLLYPAYLRASLLVGANPLSDQHLAGAIMWVSSMVLLLPALGYVLVDWMRREDREGERVDARLARASADPRVR
jgi:putative membrane protein